MTPLILLATIGGPELSIEVDAPSTCARSEAVRSELDRIVKPIPGRTLPTLEVRITIRPREDGFSEVIEIERDGVLGVRTLAGPSCQALLDAAILVIALAFGDGVEIVDDPNAPPVPDVLTRQPDVVLPLVPVILDPPRTTSFRVAGSTALRLLPDPAFGAALFARLGRGGLKLGAFIGVWGPRYEDTGAIRARFQGAEAGLEVCQRVVEHLGLCGGASVFVLRGEGIGFAGARATTAPYVASHAAVEFTGPARWSIRPVARAGISFGFEPPRFEVQGLGEVFSPGRFLPSVSIGVEL